MRFFNSSSPTCQLSVGMPSVIRNTSGFQSPLVSAVVRFTSASICVASSLSACPIEVVPLATSIGGWNAANSVSGTSTEASLPKPMIDR